MTQASVSRVLVPTITTGATHRCGTSNFCVSSTALILVLFFTMSTLRGDDVLNNDFIEAIVYVESGNRRHAISKAGARGLMQIMPATWADMTKLIYGESTSFDMAFDAKENVKVGTRYLYWIRNTLRKWHTIPTRRHVLAAYNGGIGRLREMSFKVAAMPPETRAYVKKVMKRFERSKGDN